MVVNSAGYVLSLGTKFLRVLLDVTAEMDFILGDAYTQRLFCH